MFKIVSRDPRESIWFAILNLKPDSPRFYPDLFALSRWILPEKSVKKLDEMINEIEYVVGGNILAIYLTLQNHPDTNSFFKYLVKMDDGSYKEVRLTKFEIMQKFDEIRKFIFNELKEVQKTIRFSHPQVISPQ